jgi:hypothetical protein
MTPDQVAALQPGDIIHIGPGSGCACKQMYARLVRVNQWQAWDGMSWLDVREVNEAGPDWRPIEDVRMAYVAITGLRLVRRAADIHAETRATAARRRLNGGPALIPRPRTSPESTTGRTR